MAKGTGSGSGRNGLSPPMYEQNCQTSSHAQAKGTTRMVAVVRASAGLTTHRSDQRKGASLVPRLARPARWFRPGRPCASRMIPLESRCRRSARRVVCPAKAGLFSGRQSRRGNNQEPRSLDSREEGNRTSEAYRHSLPWGDRESSGRNANERASGLESAYSEGRALNRMAKAAWVVEA